ELVRRLFISRELVRTVCKRRPDVSLCEISIEQANELLLRISPVEPPLLIAGFSRLLSPCKIHPLGEDRINLAFADIPRRDRLHAVSAYAPVVDLPLFRLRHIE